MEGLDTCGIDASNSFFFYRDAQLKRERQQDLLKGKTQGGKDLYVSDKSGENVLSKTRLNTLLTSEGIFGSKPIAELHPYTTLVSTS